VDLHADFKRHDRRSLDSPRNRTYYNDGRLSSSPIAPSVFALADTATMCSGELQASMYFHHCRGRWSLAPLAQIIFRPLSGLRPDLLLVPSDARISWLKRNDVCVTARLFRLRILDVLMRGGMTLAMKSGIWCHLFPVAFLALLHLYRFIKASQVVVMKCSPHVDLVV
jgi:hypothetical protein